MKEQPPVMPDNPYNCLIVTTIRGSDDTAFSAFEKGKQFQHDADVVWYKDKELVCPCCKKMFLLNAWGFTNENC